MYISISSLISIWLTYNIAKLYNNDYQVANLFTDRFNWNFTASSDIILGMTETPEMNWGCEDKTKLSIQLRVYFWLVLSLVAQVQNH